MMLNKDFYFDFLGDAFEIDHFVDRLEVATGLSLHKTVNQLEEGQEIVFSNELLTGVTVSYWNDQLVIEPHHARKGKYLYWKSIKVAVAIGYVSCNWNMPKWVDKTWNEVNFFNKFLIK